MDITGIGSVMDFAGKILDRVFPDPATRDAAKLELFKAQQAGAFKEMDQQFALMQSQIGVNVEEAKSADPFTSRWRPFIGWVCGVGCAWNWIGLPASLFVCAAIGHPVSGLAPADVSQMLPVLMGMLGLGSLRTIEKIKGVA
jgi:hypothetical protein